MIYKTYYDSPLGKIIIIGNNDYLISLNFLNQKHYLKNIDASFLTEKDLYVFDNVKRWLDIYFKGVQPYFNLPMLLCGSCFQIKIWQKLLQIPWGTTVTYARISNSLFGTNMSFRAVGNAVSNNPILIIIPCHRVISSNGTTGGYAAGLACKEALLNLESSYSLSKPIITF